MTQMVNEDLQNNCKTKEKGGRLGMCLPNSQWVWGANLEFNRKWKENRHYMALYVAMYYKQQLNGFII